jgi:hypothetical protein
MLRATHLRHLVHCLVYRQSLHDAAATAAHNSEKASALPRAHVTGTGRELPDAVQAQLEAAAVKAGWKGLQWYTATQAAAAGRVVPPGAPGVDFEFRGSVVTYFNSDVVTDAAAAGAETAAATAGAKSASTKTGQKKYFERSGTGKLIPPPTCAILNRERAAQPTYTRVWYTPRQAAAAGLVALEGARPTVVNAGTFGPVRWYNQAQLVPAQHQATGASTGSDADTTTGPLSAAGTTQDGAVFSSESTTTTANTGTTAAAAAASGKKAPAVGGAAVLASARLQAAARDFDTYLDGTGANFVDAAVIGQLRAASAARPAPSAGTNVSRQWLSKADLAALGMMPRDGGAFITVGVEGATAIEYINSDDIIPIV